ncbi:peptidase S1 [Niallia nealsonii]|uniref:Peptidase S1 n=2 Tax=Niallia nealsonii TaxID=115979 RepID=A0A2N0Z1Q8_9BACI|nr:peptidase S1 [Niallia nealsonii]
MGIVENKLKEEESGEKEINTFQDNSVRDEVQAEEMIAASREEQELQRTKYQQKSTAKKPKLKGVFSLLAAGILGSTLTFFTIPYTDIYNEKYDKMQEKVESLSKKVENSSSTTSGIKAETTSATASSESTSTSIADMVENSSKAIVGIVNLQQQTSQFSQSSGEDVESGSGSGIIFKEDSKYAYIATNNHVIEGANSLEISLYNGDKAEGKLIGADALTDLAVIRIDAKYATDTINFGDSSTLRPGDQVWAIGNPLGLDLSRTVTQGIVSAVDRSISVTTSAGDWDFNVIQTDAAINPGNSGGALINSSGQVIGINSLKISEDGVEGLGFAIPSNDLLPIVNEIIEKGKVERPYLGVGLASLEEVPRMYLQDLPNNVTQGVMVTNIDSNSAAAKAGLQVQDVIVSINDKKLEGSSDLRKYLYTKVEIGDTVTIKYYHEGSLKTTKIKLTSNTTASN